MRYPAPSPISEIHLAATDLEALGAFIAAFGFDDLGGGRFGVGRGASLVLHATDVDEPPVVGDTCGPRAIDLYVTDLDAARRVAPGEAGPIARIALGPVVMRQAMIHGPGGVSVVLVESTHRRPSLLDEQPGRVFSEVHSVVWCVPDRDAEADRWSEAGFTAGMKLNFADHSLSAYLGLDEAPAGIEPEPVEMVMLSDADVGATRLELLAFPGRATTVAAPRRSGLIGLGFAAPAPSAGVTVGGVTVGGIVIRR